MIVSVSSSNIVHQCEECGANQTVPVANINQPSLPTIITSGDTTVPGQYSLGIPCPCGASYWMTTSLTSEDESSGTSDHQQQSQLTRQFQAYLGYATA